MPWSGLFVVAIVLLGLAGCSKGEETVAPKPSLQAITPPQDLPSQTPPISGRAPVIVPDEIKNKWKGVKLAVEDLEAVSLRVYTVEIGSELKIENSGLLVRVNHFLPDLKIEGNSFTSGSPDLLNPSVHVEILEDGTEIFNGWLFQLFPAIHPFRHDQFGITLRDSVAAS